MRLVNRLHWIGHLMIIKDLSFKQAWKLSGIYFKLIDLYSRKKVNETE
jgi:hypothetical protein